MRQKILSRRGLLRTIAATAFLGLSLTTHSYGILIVPPSPPNYEQSQAASSVIGQTDFGQNSAGRSQSNIQAPDDVAICPITKKVFISEVSNHRILRFASYEAVQNGGQAEAVIGQTNYSNASFSATQRNLRFPRGIFVDNEGTLWVCDTGNHRVLWFDDAANLPEFYPRADGVLGQSLFTTANNPSTSTQSSMDGPNDCVVESDGTLWVADINDHRVLRFDNAAMKSNGSNADGVLGQDDYVSSSPSSSPVADEFEFPTCLAINDGGELWVADVGNNRIIRFNDAKMKANGASADAVIGQNNLSSDTFYGSSDYSVSNTYGMTWNASNNTLFVSDISYHRILVFQNATGLNGRISPVTFFGNTGLADGTGSGSQQTNTPRGMTTDSDGRLWLADYGNHRILRYDPIDAPPVVQPDLSIGPKLFRLNGNNAYTASGIGQRGKAKIVGSKRARIFLKQENDGWAIHPTTFLGSKRNRLFKVKYISFTGPVAGNVTSSMITGTLTSREQDTGDSHVFRVDVKPTSRAKDRKAKYRGYVRAKDPASIAVDTVQTFVKAKPKKEKKKKQPNSGSEGVSTLLDFVD